MHACDHPLIAVKIFVSDIKCKLFGNGSQSKLERSLVELSCLTNFSATNARALAHCHRLDILSICACVYSGKLHH